MWSPSRRRGGAGRIAAGLLLLLPAACGYHFPGGGGFPAGIESVRLEAEPPDTPLARALETALRRDDRVRLVTGAEAADAVLQVRGGRPSSRAAAIDPSGVATEYEVEVTADFRLMKAGTAVRSAQGLEVQRTFPFGAAGSPTADEANKRRAGRQASEELARQILSALTSDF
mgnify:CR=1 FL=1